MGKNTYRPRLRLSIAVLVGAVLVLLAGRFRPGQLSSRTDKDIFWTQKVFGEEKYDLIFSGDSRVYRGISPDGIAAAFAPEKVRALNFGFSIGGHNPAVFRLLEDRLSEEGRKVVVLGVSPYSLTPEAQKNGHYLKLLETPREEIFLNRFVMPHLRFLDPIEPEEAFHWIRPDSLGYYERFAPAGWVESYKVPLQPGQALAPYRKKFVGNQVSAQTMDSVFMQTRQWSGKGITVFAFRPPTSPGMVALEDSISGFDEAEFRRSFEASGGIWLDPGPLTDYVSYDGSHLTGNSALLLSRRLGEAIRARLGRGPE